MGSTSNKYSTINSKVYIASMCIARIIIWSLALFGLYI